MVSVNSLLEEVPDPRGKQGRKHPFIPLLKLILLSMLCGRKGMMAAFRLGRSLSREQLTELGFRTDLNSPCHATLSELLRYLDPEAMAVVFNRITVSPSGDADPQHIAIDGKTMRGSKDTEGKAEHVLSAFCAALEQSVGHTASRGKGREIPDALKLLETIDLEGKIVTGDAIFCQTEVTSKIVERGGEFLLPVKKNQNSLRKEIISAFENQVFTPTLWQDPEKKGHGRIERRCVELLPADALSERMRSKWSTVRSIMRITRNRDTVRAGKIVDRQTETVYLITSLSQQDPERILRLNRHHWKIETMHRDKDVTLGEDRYTNRLDNAPRAIFVLTSAVRTLLKKVSNSTTIGIEKMQENMDRAILFVSEKQLLSVL